MTMNESLPENYERAIQLAELSSVANLIADRNPSSSITQGELKTVTFNPVFYNQYMTWQGRLTLMSESQSIVKVQYNETDNTGISVYAELFKALESSMMFRISEFDPALDDDQEPTVTRLASAEDINYVINRLKSSRQYKVPEISAVRSIMRKLLS